MTTGIRAIRKSAFENAAALIEAMDLTQLYGDDATEDEELKGQAQQDVVDYLRKRI